MGGPGDAAAVIELFRMNYDRARAREERQATPAPLLDRSGPAIST